MANTDPVNDDAAVTEQILESARRSWPVRSSRPSRPGWLPTAVRNSPACPSQRRRMRRHQRRRPVGNTEIFRRMLEQPPISISSSSTTARDPIRCQVAHERRRRDQRRSSGVKGQLTAETIQGLRAASCWPTIRRTRAHIASFPPSARSTYRLGQMRGVKVTAEDDPASSTFRRYRCCERLLQHASAR